MKKIELKKGERLIHMGFVGVDSGQVMMCDPCYVDKHWKNEEFPDIRRYKHNDGTILQYRVDFENYESLIPKYNSTMNMLIAAKEVTEIPNEKTGNFSYQGACLETTSAPGYGEMRIGHSSAVVTSTYYGDGNYAVYGVLDKDGGVKQMIIDFNDELRAT